MFSKLKSKFQRLNDAIGPGPEYSKHFKFMEKYVVGPGFLIGGVIGTLITLFQIFFGKTITVNGEPTSNPFWYIIALLFPILAAMLGYALMERKYDDENGD